ncbi:hypothetical protein HYR99_20180 [Candidatus Poribacteria bacterium]|nr:hypothetical protein [Candidatus Poribacteria bacterium]
MELKLITDLIDALGKVAGGLKAIVNLPKAEREAMRKTLDETYRLIDTTLNMVIIRLGDILLPASDDAFLREAARHLRRMDAGVAGILPVLQPGRGVA